VLEAVGDGIDHEVGEDLRDRARHAAHAQVRVAVDADRVARALELRAEELRRAGDALGKIVGAVDVEELLGTIFSNFCIGK